MQLAVVRHTPAPLDRALVDSARDFAQASASPATRRAYSSDWRQFSAWCAALGARPLPASPETVCAYLAHLANEGRKVATIGRALSSISQAHKAAGLDSPRASGVVQRVFRGIRRTLGVSPRRVSPLVTPELRAVVGGLPDTLAGKRDRALLLLGFAGAFRRSELVALNVEDLATVPEGLVALVRRSKTDQEGQGKRTGIPFGPDAGLCPVRAVRAWLDVAGIREGSLFRAVTRDGRVLPWRLSGHSVACIVKRSLERAGFPSGDYSGHSLRAGLATSAARARVARHRIAVQGRWAPGSAIVDTYIRDVAAFEDNAAAGALSL